MNQVIQTLMTVFDSDSKGLKKGLDDVRDGTEKTKKEMQELDRAVGKSGDSFMDFAGKAAGALTSVLGLGAMLGSIIGQSKINDDLGDLSESLGVSAQDLAAWGDATVHWGGSIQQFGGTLKGMNEQLQMVATTGNSRMKPFFDKLGVSMTDAHGKARNFMDMLPELAKKAEGMSKTQSAAMFGKMGIDQATIMMLQRGQAETEALLKTQKELGVATDEDIEAAGKFNDELDDLHHIGRSVATMAGSALLPILTWLMEGLKGFFGTIREHKAMVLGFLGSVAVAMGIIAVATGFITLPILAIIAAILLVSAAVAILADEIYTWVNGGESIIGDFLGTWEDFRAAVLMAWDAFKDTAAFDFIQSVYNLVMNLWDYFTKTPEGLIQVKAVFAAIWAIVQKIVEGWKLIGGLVGKGLEALGWGGGDGKPMIERKTGEEQTAEQAKESGLTVEQKQAIASGDVTTEKTKEALAEGQSQIATASSSPVNAMTSNSITNGGANSQVNNTTVTGTTVNITHEKGDDPEKLGESVVGHLSKQATNAAKNSQTGMGK